TAVRERIARTYGEDYVPEKPNVYRSKKGAQDAHEAIRPTYFDRDPEEVKRYLTKDELKLYSLIWNRFVASQMRPAVYDETVVDIGATPKAPGPGSARPAWSRSWRRTASAGPPPTPRSSAPSRPASTWRSARRSSGPPSSASSSPTSWSSTSRTS